MGKSESSSKEEERATTPVLGGRVRHALSKIVDFGEPRRLQASAARRFRERRFHEAFGAAKDAVARIEGESQDYVETGMALAIASAHRILETSEGSTKWAREASNQLRAVMSAFESGSFDKAASLLEKLESAVSSLYTYEMDRHRNHVAAQGRALAEIQAMGGDATLPRRKLRRAILALAQNDREGYLEVIEEVDPLVERARAKRVQAMAREAERVEGPLREGLATALETEDFISSHFLLLASHETSFQDPAGPSAAAFGDTRKVVLLNEVLAQIELVIEQAEEHGLDVAPAAEDIAAAKRLAETEDYAEALVRGRRAYHLLKTLRAQTETSEVEAPETPPAPPPPPEPVRAFEAGPSEEEAEALGVGDEDTLLWCLECGSVQVGMDPDGGLRCLRCDARVPVTFP
ncbi:MAG: hypothetical protein ACE5I4_03590 [Thermoplasmata archaeon]